MSTTNDSRQATWPDPASDLPADFDPDLNPILARHWFGIELQDVRDLWWRQARLGHRRPAEPNVSVLDGGQR